MAVTGKGPYLAKLSGDVGLRSIKDVVACLNQALETHDDVAIGLLDAQGSDITTVQALIAAHKQAIASGKRFALAEPPDAALRDLLTQLGILDAQGSSRTPDGTLFAASSASTTDGTA